MRLTDNTGKAFAARTALTVFAVATTVLVVNRYAQAVPGGETRNALSFAGTLRNTMGAPVTSATPLTFTFRKGATIVCAPSVMVTPDSAGAFVAQIPTDGCPRSLFDGSDVTFDVASGGNVIAQNQAVNPVPYARYADRVGTPDCPTGYERDPMASPGIVCVRIVALGTASIRDEVVRVGSGSSAFWIDRYEAAIHQATTGAQLGTANTSGGGTDNIATSGLSRSGQRSRGTPPPAWAMSHPGMPTVYATWFQANEACRASGKRLPDGDEWLAAAAGTRDDVTCNSESGGARASASTNVCVSDAGAHDMIGNVMEFTRQWFASIYTSGTEPAVRWPDSSGVSYERDIVYGITSVAHAAGMERVSGMPTAVVRGGAWHDGANAGLHTMHLTQSPAAWWSSGGFRCVVSR